MTGDQTGKTEVYDAWNRLVQVKSGSTVLVSYAYDALGRRTVENAGTARDLFFSKDWQVIEERINGAAQDQYVWSPVYIDAIIERDRDADGNTANGLEERLYVQQDANWNVTALITTAGTVTARIMYDPFGQPTLLNSDWTGPGNYTLAWFYEAQGSRYDSTAGLYDKRERQLSPSLGRFESEDPASYAGGDADMYRYVGNSPAGYLDPSGLAKHRGGEPPEQLPNMNVQIPPGMSIVVAVSWDPYAIAAGAVLYTQDKAVGLANGLAGLFEQYQELSLKYGPEAALLLLGLQTGYNNAVATGQMARAPAEPVVHSAGVQARSKPYDRNGPR